LAGGAPGAGFGGSFLSNQVSLLRSRIGTAAITQLWERDSFTLQFLYTESTPVAVAPGTQAFQQTGTSVGFTWSRLLTEATTASTHLSYGRFSTQNRGNSNTYTARLLLTHQLTETLFGSLQYVHTNGGTAFGGAFVPGTGTAVQNMIIATLRKTF
jgi:uncharacterized protein (PEP-CTERM system associated)